MATHTTYYNLTKPSANDKVNIGVLNDNADIIDTALHNKVDSNDLTADNVMMSDGVTSVEDALDALANKTHYIYGDAIIGTTGLQLPDEWNELLVFAQYGNSGGIQPQSLQVTINKDITSRYPNSTYVFGGGTINSQVSVSNNTLSMLSFQVNGTEYKTTSRILYYYR